MILNEAAGMISGMSNELNAKKNNMKFPKSIIPALKQKLRQQFWLGKTTPEIYLWRWRS
jgi:hypothetical protein